MYINVEFSLDNCIKCNICTSACPVMGVTDLFPGPKYAGPQAQRFRNSKEVSPDRSVDLCSGCRVCNMVCPTGVKIAEMNSRARAALVKQGKVPALRKLRNNIIARAEMVGKFTQPIAPVANYLLDNEFVRLVADRAFGVAREAPLPALTDQRFTTWFHMRKKPLCSQRKVAYFHGCSTEYYEPRIGRMAIAVLEANGYEVIVPEQNCCGLPLLSNGEYAAARRYHQSNVECLIEFANEGIPVIGTSTSCTLTLKEEAPELLDMHEETTMLVARNTYDINEFLLNSYYEGKLNINFRPLPIDMCYHIPCQYRAHRIGKPGLNLLSLIPELSIVEIQADCCGIAGTYGYKSEKYDIAMQVGKPLFDFINNHNCSIILCDSETCRWQISHATNIPTAHPIELLAVAYGLEIESPLLQLVPNRS